MNLRRAAIPLVVVVPLVVLFWIGLGRDPNQVVTPLPGKQAPAISLHTLSGSHLSLDQFRGRPVVLNFWASWCVDCRADHQALVALWQQYRSQVAFVGVSYQDAASDARAFSRKMGSTWPDLQDPQQRTAIDYGVTGVPETFFIDRTGIIRYHVIGPVDAATAARYLDTLLGARA